MLVLLLIIHPDITLAFCRERTGWAGARQLSGGTRWPLAAHWYTLAVIDRHTLGVIAWHIFTRKVTYNALDQLLCTTTGVDCTTGVLTSYTYDGRGNLVQESDGVTTTSYTFDARDLLRGVTSGSTTLAYTYDAGGRRISENLNGTVTHYRWDEFSPYGDIVVETDGSGAVTASYVLGNGQLISQDRGGATVYYLADAQSSVRALTDTSGTITDTYAYNAFGDVHAQTGATVNPYLYTGQRFDAATDTYYLRAREYDPAVGRFLSRDTWALDTWNPVELNRYVYVAANPVNWGDPLGFGLVGLGMNLSALSLKALVVLYVGAAVYYVGAILVDFVDMIDYLLKYDDSAEDSEEVGTSPNDTSAASSDDTLDANTRRTIRSLEKNIREHQKKLDEYSANPEAHDNRGLLRNAPTEEVKQRIIEGRIRHLEQEIRNWRNDIRRLRGG